MEFESLVPNVDENDDNKKPFLDAMNWAIFNENNKNIAITGPYGAGKSSLIDTFIKKEEIKDMTVKISIATFNKDTVQNTNNKNQERQDNKVVENKLQDTDIPLENILEQQILQQLFYRIEPDKILFSKFTRIFDLDKYKTLATVFFMLIMSVITYSMFKFEWLPKAFNKFTSGDLNFTAVIVLVGIALAAAYTYFIYICILIFQKLGLSKFGFGSTSIEVVTKDNNTVFNRYLDEIIYFFKQSKYKYVIFEDLDRFENISIYERLKSLNIILNNTKQLSEQNIVFIYALKDDLFINNDGSHEIYNRTKFFDFIIPTVKVVHTSNAENVLLKRLEGEFQSENNLIGLTRDFIEDIALFINDMRILKNICNEYKIYKDALMNNGITANKLFAFVVYKNIYPGDYSSLLSNKGKVYEILNIKDLIINKIEKKIEAIQKQIDLGTLSNTYNSSEIETLFYLDKEDELRGIRKIDVLYNDKEKTFDVNNSYRSINKFVGLFDYCAQLEENFRLRIYEHSYSPSILDKGIDFFSKTGKLNYLERYKGVSYNEKKKSLSKKRSILQGRIQSIKTNSISILIKNGYLDCELLENIKKDDEFLYFLIRNGWIDENYEDYLSYFYEGSLSKNDNKLLKAIRNGLLEDENIKLKNTRRVLERIRLEEITSQSVFNYDLLEYLIENREENAKKFSKMVELLFSNKESKEYCLRFIEFVSEKNKFDIVGALISKANELGFEIWESININLDTQREENFAYSIINSWLAISNNFNSVKVMKEFIEQLEPRKIYSNCNSDSILQMLEDLDIKFKDITSLDGEIKNYVAEHSYFEISLINIKHIIEEINIKNALDNELISEYIKENIKAFVENVILKLNNYIEDEDTLIDFLNDKQLDERLKYQLIEKSSNRIEDISKLDSVKDLVALDKMQCTINNIVFLINHDEYKEEIVSLNTVFNNKSNWNQLLHHKNELKQVSEDVFNQITEEFFKSEIVNGKAMGTLFNDTKRYIMVQDYLLESSDENLYDKLSALINVLDWDIEVYRFISNYEDNELLLQYLFEVLKDYGFDKIKDDLLQLNFEGLLPWSEELISRLEFNNEERITYFKHVSPKVPEQFVLEETSATIPLSSELNLKWQGKEANTSYFIYLLDGEVENSIIENAIEELDFWDIQIFDKLAQISEDFALSFAKKYEQELFDNKFTQEDFNLLTKGNISNELIKNLYNYNKFEPSVEFRNWLIDEEQYTSLLELYNEKEIIKSYRKQQYISMILYWYINTKKLKREEIYELLSNLKPPFNKIGIGKGNNKKFIYNEWTKKLMEYFEEKNIVSTVYCNENSGIYINNKRK